MFVLRGAGHFNFFCLDFRAPSNESKCLAGFWLFLIGTLNVIWLKYNHLQVYHTVRLSERFLFGLIHLTDRELAVAATNTDPTAAYLERLFKFCLDRTLEAHYSAKGNQLIGSDSRVVCD